MKDLIKTIDFSQATALQFNQTELGVYYVVYPCDIKTGEPISSGMFIMKKCSETHFDHLAPTDIISNNFYELYELINPALK